MNTVMYTVRVGEEERKYPKGTTYLQVAKDFQEQYSHDILLVFVNGYRLQELRKELPGDCSLRFVTAEDPIGQKTYKRSMCLLMIKAIHDVSGLGTELKVRIHYALSKGLYCTLEGDVTLDREFLDKVEARMREVSEKRVPIQKRSVHTEEARQIFSRYKMYDKERLLRYRRVSRINIYTLSHYEDYYFGYMVPDAGYLRYFKLHLYDEGFVLQMPVYTDPEHVPAFEPQEKLFQVMKESAKWGDEQEIRTVGALNDKVVYHNMQDTVLAQEAYQEKKIAEIAGKISSNPKVKFVLVAGPSSSGKTTFAQRLAIELRVAGMKPHMISVDNYYLDRDQTPLDEEGKPDFECLEAVDVRQFNLDMGRLLKGEEVMLPSFDFEEGRRKYCGNSMKFGEQDVLIIEGIHCLNPKLTEGLKDENKFKIYISALTQLNVDEHNRIPTTDGRLLRRIVRDARTRNTSAGQTIAMWQAVRRGEENNIFPYQEGADVMFNSALIYELAVLKQYVEPLLFQIDRNSPEYPEAKRLLKFMDYFVGIPSEYVPTNSLLREFIGGGVFHL